MKKIETEYGQYINADFFSLELVPHSISTIITDIPYLDYTSAIKNGSRNLTEWAEFVDFMAKRFNEICNEDANILIFTGMWGECIVLKYMESHFNLKQKLIWEITNPRPIDMINGHTMRNVINVIEPIGWYARGKDYYFDESAMREFQNGRLTNVIKCGRSSNSQYQSKPLILIKLLVQTFANPDKIVLDPFSGIGTLGRVAEELGINWICVEKDEEVFKKGAESLRGGKNARVSTVRTG